ncbi:MAG: hypothetical protein LBF16_11485 [Pseudomonadales bacterium]|nr:hypothetical protein [Pseudomonadales bacterium]
MRTFWQGLAVITFVTLSGGQVLAAAAEGGGAARGPTPRPTLFFEETWQPAKPGENPISQDYVANKALELKLYGPKHEELAVTGIGVGDAGYDANPIHTWSGLCGAGCTFALRHKDSYADLSGTARIMVQSKTSGLHKIQPFVKLADGNTYVGDTDLGQTYDFLFEEFPLKQVRWIAFDAETGMTKGNLLESIDLSKVDEIGFTDLQPGAGHGAGGWSDVAVIRVYAKAVPR